MGTDSLLPLLDVGGTAGLDASSLASFVVVVVYRCAYEPAEPAAGPQDSHLGLQLSEEAGTGLPLHAGQSNHGGQAGGESEPCRHGYARRWVESRHPLNGVNSYK